MPYFAIARDASVEKSETDAKITDKGSVSNEYIEDDVSQLEGIPRLKGPASRRSYFASAAHRQQITYHPQVCVILFFYTYPTHSYLVLRTRSAPTSAMDSFPFPK